MMTNKEIQTLYKKSFDAAMPYIKLDGESAKNPFEALDVLKESIQGLSTITEYNPSNWSSLWMIGKIHQAIKEHEKSYESLFKAYRAIMRVGEGCEPTLHADIMRELGVECLYTGRFKDAVYYCNLAVEYDMKDYTLWSNVAIAKVFVGDLDAAENWANRALEKMPEDKPAQSTLRIIKEIREGTRSIPTNFEQLESESW